MERDVNQFECPKKNPKTGLTMNVIARNQNKMKATNIEEYI